MYKISILLAMFMLSLYGREEVMAVKGCPAFNNMKHSSNSHNVMLHKEQTYTLLRYHKGQALVLLKGEQPAQRWVDAACFKAKTSLLKKEKMYNEHQDISNKMSQHNILALSWHNAFCETHRYKKECKRPRFPLSNRPYEERHFVLHGLWPQPKNKLYCHIDSRVKNLDRYKKWHKLPSLELGERMRKELATVMPGLSSNLHKHQWVKHGSCYGSSAKQYFSDAISLVKQVNDSKVGKFFQKNIGKRVTLQQVRTLFNRTFGFGSGSRVELRCKGGLITELWLHLGAGGASLATLLKKGKATRSHCKAGLLDKAGF